MMQRQHQAAAMQATAGAAAGAHPTAAAMQASGLTSLMESEEGRSKVSVRIRDILTYSLL